MDPDFTDPLFIDFGSSVNVNDELRRTLQNETIEIDHAIKSLQSYIAAEERTFAQLNKDYTHALSEMFHLSRSAEENQDNAVVKEQIQMKLKEGLKEQERFLTGPELIETDEEDIDASNQRVQVTKNGLKCISMAVHAEESAAEIRSIARSIQVAKENKAEFMAKQVEVQCQIDALSNRIAREQKNVNTWNHDVLKETREFAILKERKNHALNVLQKTRAKMGENTQQYTIESNKLLSNQTNHQNTESEWNQSHQDLHSIVDGLRKELELLSSSREESSGLIANLRANLEENDVLQKDIRSYKDRIPLNQERLEKLSLYEQQLCTELEMIKAEGLKLEQEKDVQMKTKKDLDVLTAENDQADENMLQPARKDYSAILEEIDTLANSISSLQDHNAASKAALVSAFFSEKKTIQDLEAKILEKEKLIEQEALDIDLINKEITDVKESCSNDISRFEDLRMKYISAQKAQEAILESLTTKREKEKQAILQTFSTRVSNEMLKLEAMDCGIELLMKADELESELKNIKMFA